MISTRPRPGPRPLPGRRPSPEAGREPEPPVAVTDDVAVVARSGLAYLGGAVASVLANFGLVFVVARGVSAVDAGVFFAVTSTFLIAQTIGRLGADTAMVYFIARWRAQGRDELVRPGIRMAGRCVIGACSLVAITVLVTAPQLSSLIGADSGGTTAVLRVLALALPLATAGDVAMGISRGLFDVGPTVLVDKIVRPLLQVGLVLLVIVIGHDGWLGYAWALPYALAFGALAIATRRAIRRKVGHGDRQRVEPTALRREYWAFALPRMFAGAAQIVLQRLDIVLLAAISGPRDAAVYTAATRFLVVGQFLNQAIGAPLQPRISATLSAGDVRGAERLYRTATAWLVLTNWPLFGIALSLAPAYISVFGSGYDDGIPLVVILAATMLVATACGAVDTVVIMAGRATWNLGTTLLALALNVALNLALIPPYGLIGAAIAWSVSILAANLVPLALVSGGLHLHPYGRATRAAIVLTGSCFVALPSVVKGISGSTVLAAAACLLGLIAYAAGLWRWRVMFDLDGLLRRRPSRTVTEATG